MSNKEAKKAAGYFAAELIKDGMKVGIGTGSTVFYFIEKLLERCKGGLKISAAFSSIRSKELALKGPIKWIPDDLFTRLDVTVDGADEIDPAKNMIKGGGGALLREKMLASSSDEMIVIVDESKARPCLGEVKLPVEICPFAYTSTIHKIEALSLQGEIRKGEDGQPYHTDNGNLIIDLELTPPLFNPEKLHADLITIPGVMETGLFTSLAGRVIVGHSDGQVTERP